MKRFAFLFLVLIIALGSGVQNTYSQDSIVSIPDTAFLYTLIDKGVDTNGDSLISYTEAAATISLDVSPGKIGDMTGIEAFVNLDTLYCDGIGLTSLDVSKNTALTFLDCKYNRLTSLDVSNHTALLELNCIFNENLTSLNVSNNTALTSLYCRSNQLTSLDVSNDTALTFLDCKYNRLTSLDVSTNTALTDLDCIANQLTSLNVSDNKALANLECQRNQLTSLDVSNDTALTHLDCSNNQLTSLDVSTNAALTNLDCRYNLLTSLDVSNNTSLEYLYLQSNISLSQVCVWTTPFPPEGVVVIFDNCDNVFFSTECDTFKLPTIQYIRFGSTGDPLNGLTVTWQNVGISDSIAWGYTSNLEEGKFKAIKRVNAFWKTVYDYTFPALPADTTIHYALFDSKDSIWTLPREYRTASDASDNKFSFTTFGDSRTYPMQWRKIAEATLETDFTLFLGDIIANGAIESDWDAWFEYGEKFVTRELIYHCIGNHDDDDSPSSYDNYLSLFTLPGNELYYSFTYGNAVFICLNSQDPGNTAQNSWLHSTLEANKDTTWKFVFFHKPFYTSPKHVGEMDEYFDNWWKAFDDYGVDMIFNGHTHNYQRTKPINRNISTTSPVDKYGGIGDGRCQIVTGAAGAPLSGAADPGLWWLERTENKLHFCNIVIDGDALTFKAYDENQVVFDELILDKTAGINDLRSTNCRIYPNPTIDLLSIETNDPGHHTIEITSLSGQLLYSIKMEGSTLQIDLSSFQKGVYLITIRNKDFVTTRKIIKL